MDTRLIISTVITGKVFIVAFTNGVGLPVGIALTGNSLLFCLAKAINKNPLK